MKVTTETTHTVECSTWRVYNDGNDINIVHFENGMTWATSVTQIKELRDALNKYIELAEGQS